jgi:RNA polymerase sigma-70 factor (ECF subfamily)
MEEHQLIEQIKQRDENACRRFIDLHKDMVFRICLGFFNNKEDAEELTQDVFIEAISNIHAFKKEAKIQTWLYRIAINRSLNFKRKQKQFSFMERLGLSSSVEKEMEKHNPSASEEGEETKKITEENNSILYCCIDSLKEEQRIAFTLNKMDGFSYAEVADIMKISLSKTETLIYRAKQKLQEKLVKQLNR